MTSITPQDVAIGEVAGGVDTHADTGSLTRRPQPPQQPRADLNACDRVRRQVSSEARNLIAQRAPGRVGAMQRSRAVPAEGRRSSA